MSAFEMLNLMIKRLFHSFVKCCKGNSEETCVLGFPVRIWLCCLVILVLLARLFVGI